MKKTDIGKSKIKAGKKKTVTCVTVYIKLAATYFPTRALLQYHRRSKSLLPSSKWFRVFPLGYYHQQW